jgi:hypothetical protein
MCVQTCYCVLGPVVSEFKKRNAASCGKNKTGVEVSRMETSKFEYYTVMRFAHHSGIMTCICISMFGTCFSLHMKWYSNK